MQQALGGIHDLHQASIFAVVLSEITAVLSEIIAVLLIFKIGLLLRWSTPLLTDFLLSFGRTGAKVKSNIVVVEGLAESQLEAFPFID